MKIEIITPIIVVVLLSIMAVAALYGIAIKDSTSQTSTGIANSCEICEVKYDTTALGIVYNYESGEGLCVCSENQTEPFFTLNEV